MPRSCSTSRLAVVGGPGVIGNGGFGIKIVFWTNGPARMPNLELLMPPKPSAPHLR